MMDEYSDDLLPSKSARKREVDALQDIGEQLMNLKPADLARLPLNDALLHGIEESRRITSHEARRRQAQYIGKLMRGANGDEIEQALAALTDPLRHKRLLDWMERLDGCADTRAAQPVINEIISLYPDAERQHLRNLLRNYLASRAPEGVIPDDVTKDKFRRERRKFYDYLNELERHAPLY